MIDPLLSLSLSVESNPEVFALLLGSGVSRSAGIPTGWEVVLDLIRRLAKAENQDCGADPAAWLKQHHQMEPNYSELLDALARTPAERRQLLSGYFEAISEEEREQNLKTPTKAHRAISELVAAGYIRVILTTNFDRLMERAIEDAGIVPVVVSSAEACAGMLPLAHQKCLVVKLHGDYLDVRNRNTPDELAKYEDATNQLLDRVLDEFGLLICGWSGDWDTALRHAVERCPTRRFSTYWASRGGKLSKIGKELLTLRGGAVINISDSDSFFATLAEQVQSLAEIRAPHPLSVAAAVATEKRYLAEDRHRIRLHDLLVTEAKKAAREIELDQTEWLKAGDRAEEVPSHFESQRRSLEVLLNLIAAGAYWGRTPEQTELWASCIRLIAADPFRGMDGNHLNETVRLYPAIVLLYAAGISALAAGREDVLATLFARTTVLNQDGQREPLAQSYFWGNFHTYAKLLAPNKSAPISEHFYSILAAPLSGLLVEAQSYDSFFDSFEYRRNLVYAYLDAKDDPSKEFWAPELRLTWQFRWRMDKHNPLEPHSRSVLDQGQDWPFLQEGFFDGSAPLVQKWVQKHESFQRERGRRM